MSILVTGGAGFIGSHVCQALLERGDSVVIVDDLNDYYAPWEKEKNLGLISKAGFYNADITDMQAMQDIFSENQIDKIVHLAARAGVRASLEEPLLYTKVNCIGTANILELARMHAVKSVVVASSSSVYGDRAEGCFRETDPADEPISPYAATKRICEHISYSYSKNYGMKITCLRFFTVYGPRGRPDMAPRKFTEKILKGEPIEVYGDGSTKRDYTYITDIVAGVVSALDKELHFEIINLGNNKPVQLSQFISQIEKCTGRKAKIQRKQLQPGDVTVTCADITKAKELLEYNPRVSTQQGLENLADWVKGLDYL